MFFYYSEIDFVWLLLNLFLKGEKATCFEKHVFKITLWIAHFVNDHVNCWEGVTNLVNVPLALGFCSPALNMSFSPTDPHF